MLIQETRDAIPRTLAAQCAAVQAGTQSPEVVAALALAAGGSVGEAIDLLHVALSASSNAGVPSADENAIASVVGVLREHRVKCNAMGAFYKAQGSLLEAGGLGNDTIAATARFFDGALRICPQASALPSSLGSAALLERATQETLQYLLRERFLMPRRRVLELGCGSGRMQWAVAPYVAEAIGVDISADMIEAAKRRRKGIPNVRFLHTAAHAVPAVRDHDVHLVLAVDTFPYIRHAGELVIAATFAEVARLLRDDGDFVVLGYSYGGDVDRDRVDIEAAGRTAGLELVSFAAKPMKYSDGSVFHLRRMRAA